jgi:hypothetical protein
MQNEKQEICDILKLICETLKLVEKRLEHYDRQIRNQERVMWGAFVAGAFILAMLTSFGR